MSTSATPRLAPQLFPSALHPSRHSPVHSQPLLVSRVPSSLSVALRLRRRYSCPALGSSPNSKSQTPPPKLQFLGLLYLDSHAFVLLPGMIFCIFWKFGHLHPPADIGFCEGFGVWEPTWSQLSCSFFVLVMNDSIFQKGKKRSKWSKKTNFIHLINLRHEFLTMHEILNLYRLQYPLIFQSNFRGSWCNTKNIGSCGLGASYYLCSAVKLSHL